MPAKALLSLLGVCTLLLSACGQTASAPASAEVTPAPASGIATRRLLPADSGTDPFIASIVLPHNEGTFPAAPGYDVFLTSCTICHSPRYVSMQPPLSRAVWTAEVKKMTAVFGAPIAPEQASQVVDYLVYVQTQAPSHGSP